MFEELIQAIEKRNFKKTFEILEQIEAKELYRLTDQGYSALKLLCIINKVPDCAKGDYIKAIELTLAKAPNLFCIDNSKEFNIHIQDLITRSCMLLKVLQMANQHI